MSNGYEKAEERDMSNVSEEEKVLREKQRQRNEKFLKRLWKLETQVNSGILEGTHDVRFLIIALQDFLQKQYEIPQKARMSAGLTTYLEMDSYRVVVDYSKTRAEMIKLGKYCYFNRDINDKNFPRQGVGKSKVELVLVHMNKLASTAEVLAHLKEEGLEPAKIEHLLAFGVAYPMMQREFPIFALGSVWVAPNGDRCYPSLDYGGSKRELYLTWDDGDHLWRATIRFLAVRK